MGRMGAEDPSILPSALYRWVTLPALTSMPSTISSPRSLMS